MERTSGRTQGLKKVVAMVALMAAMASTGCGENALMNPTSEMVAAGGDANLAKSTDNGGQTMLPGGQPMLP